MRLENLKGVGIPLVNAFFAIRQNVFLNTAVKQTKISLESIGNWFLTPSRYLFGGKTITNMDKKTGAFETSPSCDYKKCRFIKTVLAIIALPLSWLIGCILKGLSFLGREARWHHDIIKKSQNPYKQTSHLAEYKAQGIDQIHCDEVFESKKLPKQPPTELHKKFAEGIQDIGLLLDAAKIPWWVDAGTALGVYQFGGSIPWDKDADISIIGQDHDNVLNILKKLPADKYTVQDWSSYEHPGTLIKVYMKGYQSQIDIYHSFLKPEEKTIKYFYSYKDSKIVPSAWKKNEKNSETPAAYDTVFPLKRAKFEGVDVWVPNKLEQYLLPKYYFCLDPAKVWDEAKHKYVKVPNHPYWIALESDRLTAA